MLLIHLDINKFGHPMLSGMGLKCRFDNGLKVLFEDFSKGLWWISYIYTLIIHTHKTDLSIFVGVVCLLVLSTLRDQD